MKKHLFADVYVIQTVPASCMNRDDIGRPKTADYGGVERARVSSQAWKYAMRKYFVENELLEIGFRSKCVPEIVAKEVMKISPEVEYQQALENVKNAFINFMGLKFDENKPDRTATLLFVNNDQVKALAALVAEGNQDKKAFEKAMNKKSTADIYLFGRMVANDKQLSLGCDAAVQVAHALSTHAVHTEYDYFTAEDERAPEDETGGAYLDTMEFTSSTLYRYATINVTELQKHLGEDTPVTVRAFVDAFIHSMPKGKQASYANHTNVDLVYVAVREDQPVNLSGAFDTPVENTKSGFAKKSCEILLAYAEKTCSMFADEPVLALGSGDAALLEGHAEVMHVRKLLDRLESYMADVCGKDEE